MEKPVQHRFGHTVTVDDRLEGFLKELTGEPNLQAAVEKFDTVCVMHFIDSQEILDLLAKLRGFYGVT